MTLKGNPMNREASALTLIVAFVAGIGLNAVVGSQTAGAVSVQNQTQTILPQYYYPKFEGDAPPKTNFRAARPEEYPQLFGGDCNLWRRGRAIFNCVDPSPPRRRNPVGR
jgi:hypothetical protein